MWDPWAEAEQREHLDIVDHPCAADAGGGIHIAVDDRAVIVLDPDLPAELRRAVLTHELVHDERGGSCAHPGMPPSWAAVVARDEWAVEREAALRLVPLDDLRPWVAQRLEVGECVSVDDVARRWGVPRRAAAVVLGLLAAV